MKALRKKFLVSIILAIVCAFSAFCLTACGENSQDNFNGTYYMYTADGTDSSSFVELIDGTWHMCIEAYGIDANGEYFVQGGYYNF